MKIYRVYFNRKNEAPQVWSVDEGTQDSEINVVSFIINPGCTVRSHYNGEPVNRDTPSAWLTVECHEMQLYKGVVHFI